jgi:hypothetical protein
VIYYCTEESLVTLLVFRYYMTATQQRGLVSLAAVGIFLITSTAIANISTGNSNTNISSDVSFSLVSLNKPSDAVVGDLLLAGISVNGGSAAGIAAPSGWTLVNRTDNDTNVSVSSYYKIVGSSEPSSYDWTITPQARGVGGITRFSGVSTAAPIDVFASSIGRGSSATAPAVTTTANNEYVVSLFAVNVGKDNTLFATSTEMVKLYDIKNQPYGPTASAQDKLQTSAGSSGTFASSFNSGTRDWAAQTIALRTGNVTLVSDNFESYTASSDLEGQNGGNGWTNAWTQHHQFSIPFVVQNSVAFEGSRAVLYSHPANEQDYVFRSFSPMASGTLHWAQMKDSYNSGQGVYLFSGSIPVIVIYQDSVVGVNGAVWTADTPTGAVVLGPYAINTFETADVQFDVSTQKFRVSINGGTYSSWLDFNNTVSSIDTLWLAEGAAGGSGTINNYWDDVHF